MAGYMYIDSIPGEVTQGSRAAWASPNGKGKDEFYVGWIELHSVTQTVTRAIETGRSGAARARAGCVLEEIEVEKEVDRTSTHLLEACSGGKAFPQVFIHLCSAMADSPQTIGHSLHPYLEFRLYSVKVTSYTINGSGLDDGTIPTETLNLNFDKVVWRYWPIGPTPEEPDVAANFVHKAHITGWDVVKATKFTA
jgi:type VI secretion system secreted protein Hcp